MRPRIMMRPFSSSLPSPNDEIIHSNSRYIHTVPPWHYGGALYLGIPFYLVVVGAVSIIAATVLLAIGVFTMKKM